MSNAADILRQAKEAEGLASNHKNLWQDISNYCAPRKGGIDTTTTVLDDTQANNIYDQEMSLAAQTFSSGMYDYMLTGKWFDFEAPKLGQQEAPESAQRWYRQCAEITLEHLANSNFSTTAHEHVLDRAIFGTAHIHVEADFDRLHFDREPVGNFFAYPDGKKMLTTVFIKYTLTARQIADKFGEEAIAKAPKALAAYQDKTKCDTQEFIVWYKTAPRKIGEYDSTKMDGINKPIESVYVLEEDKVILREGGYDEASDFISRHLVWNDSVYGWSPAVLALPVARQLNYVEKIMDTLGEISAYPRMLIPEGMREDIDIRAGGATYYDPLSGSDGKPETWGTEGRYDIGADRSEKKREQINRIFHVDLFRALAARDKTMTATEVMELVEEKLIHFSPTFQRFTSETLTPLLQRVFSILLRNGAFPPPPPEAVVMSTEGGAIETPKVQYVSKIALALKSLQNKSLLDFIGVLRQLVELDPDTVIPVLRHKLNLGRIIDGVGANSSVPVEWSNTPEEEQQSREAEAQAQQQAQAAQLLEQGASAAKDLGQSGILEQ